jgi:hypothetical protein
MRLLVLSPAMLATGVVYAATVTLFVLSTKLTTAANAIFLQATAPLYLLLLGPLRPARTVSRPGTSRFSWPCGGAGSLRDRPARADDDSSRIR